MDQNYNNHVRLIPMYHYVLYTLIAAILGGAIVNFVKSFDDTSNHYNAALILVISIVLILIAWYCRSFALTAQDRAIRAEENFRHLMLTGKPLDGRVRLGQIIALRFASDAEFPDLAARAVRENMPPKEIKKAIKNWRGDYHRV